MFLPIVMLPQIISYRYLAKNMVTFDEIPDAYFANDLLEYEDPAKIWIKQEYVAPICASSALLSLALGVAYVMKYKGDK